MPYTYSNAKYAHDEGDSLMHCVITAYNDYDHIFIGLGILRPLYYKFPEASSAYLYSNQV